MLTPRMGFLFEIWTSSEGKGKEGAFEFCPLNLKFQAFRVTFTWFNFPDEL